MKADAFALIDTYTTAMTWAVRGWYAALIVLVAFAAWVVIEIGRRVFDRIGADFTRARQTIADIQQPRKEES
ncbi:hypothetical protein [Streptomyces sp. BA2]|uniref:hypothetical protein n=1 Tax=Streptomyces sp. BA2 TaxID=436595 RepID=UPI001326C7F5|nr:hypothetical protein [Streptomyces sp. BA2]MWA08824.1 hypothetical protein [Streptomyces sp. BA2]